MSAYSEKPPRSDVKAQSTDETRTFKKTQSVHSRPQATDHDIHEDYLKDPPRNVPDGAVPGFTDDGMKATPKAEKISRDPLAHVRGGGGGDPPLGLFEEEGTGRAKPLDVQTELIETSESTSRA